jgi:4-hydroxy-tetrahydrodipicolinate synthase
MTYHGIIPPVSTPFTEDHQVDVPSLERLLEYLIVAGVHGLFVLGSTSEVVFLTPAQRQLVLETAKRVVRGRVPILAGVIAETTPACLEHAHMAKNAGVDALVLTMPYYTRPSQAEAVEHFRIIHREVGLPIFAYDIPVAVGRKLERPSLLELAREGTIIGLKDSSADEGNFRGVLLETRDLENFAVFTGSELTVDAALLMGAHGCVPGLGNVDPDGYVRLYNACHAGDWASAKLEQERLYALFNLIFAGVPRMGIGASAMGGFKTALMLRGIIRTNIVGRPGPRYTAAEVEIVREHLERAGLM